METTELVWSTLHIFIFKATGLLCKVHKYFFNNNCATSASFILYWSNVHFAKWPAGVAMKDEHYDFLLRLWPNKMYTFCSSKITGMVSLIYVCMCHCEPPGQNVCIVSQIFLILVSNCFKRFSILSQTCLGQMSQFGLNFRPFWHLRHNWDCPHLRAIWEQFETVFCVVKMVSKRSQKCLKKGFGGI